jgi:hypothetical protein
MVNFSTGCKVVSHPTAEFGLQRRGHATRDEQAAEKVCTEQKSNSAGLNSLRKNPDF